MKLAALVQALEGLAEVRVIAGGVDIESIDVRAVQDDSRKVGPGDLFVAVRGLRVDGHAYVDQAIAQGAVAVVVERPLAGEAARVPHIVVPHAAKVLGVLAAARAGHPGERMTLAGITGTNGKTTCAYLTEAVLRAAEARPGVIGTVSYRYGDVTVPAPYTTPTPLVLQGVLGDMLRADCTHAVLEVSSAALAMDRLAGVRFRVAAFTNFTQDHLDIHGSMDAYRAAKERLFRDHLAPGGTAVINIDDPAAPAMISALGAGARVLRVSARGDAAADVRVLAAETTIDGVRATLATPRGPVTVASRALLGHYNLANIAVVVGIAEALELPHAAVARGIAEMPGVPGRVERVPNPANLDILVDYAHTPDALENVLAALRPLTRRRLICVFGCGGDRDPDKRPKMGAAAAAGADLVIVTSDNPRTEDPRAIIDAILPGVPASFPPPFFVHEDRRLAIAAAVFEAVPGDVVLIAGKGHEDYQIIGAEKLRFDDREEAAAAVAARRRFPVDELAAACGGEVTRRRADGFSRVIIDGRDSAPGDLYVAIRGERFDGHDFCAQAVAAGATGVVVERGRAPRDPAGALLDVTVIEVGDTRAAIGAMARWHRRRWAREPRYPHGRTDAFAPVVGITGSAGKTTTKELIAAALSARYCVHATRGSLNNETGVPLTLLGLMPHHEAAVIEMGMRGLGQIAYLAQVAEPDVGAVLNAGTAHIGVVGSADAIARGKSEIFAALGPHGTAVFPADDARLAGHAQAAPRRLRFGRASENPGDPPEVAVVGYTPVLLEPGAPGAQQGAQQGARPGTRPGAQIDLAFHGGAAAGVTRASARIPLVGEHNAVNAACAVACAVAAGVPAGDAARALSRARPPALRGQIREVAGRRVLVDCYNANPASMRVALAAVAELSRTHGGRALAVLGDMLELGDEAASAHAEIGAAAAAHDVAVIALGEHAPALAGARGLVAPDPDAAAAAALERAAPGDWILVKASRGVRLERVIEAMQRLAQTRVDTL